jgi:hypothetical protein
MSSSTTMNDFKEKLAHVVDSMLARGCPCRFPRFRATCARDTSEVGARGYMTWEQGLLIQRFEQTVPNGGIGPAGTWSTRGHCAICGAQFVRTSEEVFRDAWLDRLEITPALPDIGEPVHTALPRCGKFYSIGPEQHHDAKHLVDIQYPLVSQDDWLAWLSA